MFHFTISVSGPVVGSSGQRVKRPDRVVDSGPCSVE
jgi:hypothetical protein